MKAYRHNSLVYIPITKHASSSYTYFFEQILNWEEIEFRNIDWKTEKVFAHIMNPRERHFKGTVEAVSILGLEYLLDDPIFCKLLQSAVLDIHSYPLSVTFGDLVNLIDWIPIDHSIISGDWLTKKFLNDHGNNVDCIDIPKINIADSNKKHLSNKIRKIIDGQPVDHRLTYFYNLDYVLYYSVNENLQFHELNNLPWNQCSWLVNKQDISCWEAK